METKQEWCSQHGHGEFFLADTQHGGRALHCPECFPALLAELTAIEAGVERKRAANDEVDASLVALASTVREVLAKKAAVKHVASSRAALRNALARYDAALGKQADAD